MNAILPTPLGLLAARWAPAGLCELRFVDAADGTAQAANAERDHLADWLADYFAGRPRPWDRPLAPVGTPFEQRVWALLQGIAAGETRRYGDLATALGQPAAARAVGRAVGRNPIALIIPCHRVIGAGGRLTGYAWGLARKQALLALEADRLQPSLKPPSTGSTAPVT